MYRGSELLVRAVPRLDAAREVREEVGAAVSQALADAGAPIPVRVELVEEIEREPGPAARSSS